MQRISAKERFLQTVNRSPESIAISGKDDRINYEQLATKVSQLGAAIESEAQAPSTMCCVLSDHEIPAIVAAFAVVIAEHAYTPLSTTDPVELLKRRMSLSGARIILASRENLDLAAELSDDDITIICIEDQWERCAEQMPSGSGFNPEAPAYLFFTSGSSGVPKAVTHSHASLLRSVECYLADTQLSPDHNVSLLTSLGFTPSVFSLFGALLTGATLYPWNLAKKGVVGLSDWVLREEITHIYTTPTVYRRWLSSCDAPLSASQVKMVMLAGEPMLSSDVTLFKQNFSAETRLYNGMGTSETSCVARYFVDLTLSYRDGRIPIGVAYDDIDARIESAAGQLLGPNETGELVLVGQHFSRGYTHADSESQNRFEFDADNKTWRYRTGDLVKRLDDGQLVHCGRLDAQVKVNGVRIELDEIESALLSHDRVSEVAVLTTQDSNQETSLIAYVAGRDIEELSPQKLREYLLTKLPSAFVPGTFVNLASLPMLSAGKVDKTTLRSIEVKPTTSETPDTEPRDHFEQEILNGFRHAFDDPGFGFTDDFFEHGGDSLRALEVAIAIEERTGYPVSSSSMMSFPTPINMAHHLKGQMQSSQKNDIIQFSAGSDANVTSGPLVCVPGVGGHALTYRKLANALPDCIPMYALEVQGLDGRTTPFESVKALAAYFAIQIREQFPTGPLNFGGYSLGGQVAFELASLFQKEGRDIGQLYLIDCYTVRYFAFEARHRAREARRAELKEQGVLKWAENRLKRTLAAKVLTRPEQSDSAKFQEMTGINPSLELTERMETIQSALYKAAHANTPSPQAVPTTSIEASAPADPPGDCYSYWDELTKGSVRHVKIDANHLSIMRNDAIVAKVAKIIADDMVSERSARSTQQSGAIHDLCRYWSADGKADLEVDYVDSAELPQSTACLLDHADSMTRTLSRKYNQKIEVKVLAKSQVGGHLVRKVSLKPAGSPYDCAMAVIRIDLTALDANSRPDIIEGREPFGTILDKHNIGWCKQPASFFAIHPDEDIARRLNCKAETNKLYGRHNVLSLHDGCKFADVIEVVASLDA